jgi:FHS family Na+ dependent glucose MFS transporter 1
MSESTVASLRHLLSEDGARISKTIGYYGAFIALGAAGAALGPTLPDLAKNTQTPLGAVSILFTAHALGYLLGSLQSGWSYDRLLGHRVMITGLAVMAAMLILVPTISWLWLLAAVWLVLGAAGSTIDVGGNTLLIWVHRDKVGPFMNGLHFFFGVGAALSPLIIAWVTLLGGGLHQAYWVLALMALPAFVWLLRLPSPAAQTASATTPHKKAAPFLIVLLVFFFFLHVGGESSFGGWIYTYALALDLSSPTIARYLTSAFWGALTLGRLLSIPLAARVKPSTILFGSLLTGVASLSIIVLWSNSSAAVWVGTLGIGLSIASLFPSTFSMVERYVTVTGRVSSWFLIGASLGGMVLPWLIGQLFEQLGPRATMVTILIDFVIATIVFTAIFLQLVRRSGTAPADLPGEA